MRRPPFLFLFLPFALAASATTGSDGGAVQIETRTGGQALQGAHCKVVTHGGSWQVVTPGVVRVGPVQGDLHVICDKPGFRTSEFVYRASAVRGSGMGLGISGGSRVGLGLGLSVPLGVGAARYPPHIVVDMNPQ